MPPGADAVSCAGEFVLLLLGGRVVADDDDNDDELVDGRRAGGAAGSSIGGLGGGRTGVMRVVAVVSFVVVSEPVSCVGGASRSGRGRGAPTMMVSFRRRQVPASQASARAALRRQLDHGPTDGGALHGDVARQRLGRRLGPGSRGDGQAHQRGPHGRGP